MTKKTGRAATEMAIPPIVDPALDQVKLSGAMDAMREQAQTDQAELVDLAVGIGALQAFDLMQKFASAAQIKLFKRIRESNQIKNLRLRGADEEVKSFDSIREACPYLFGRTYQSMLDAEGRYDTYGEEAYEGAVRLRLNDSALRAARALPPEQLEKVRTAIGNGSTKAEVLTVIEDLAEKIQKAEASAADAKAELKASEELLAVKNKSIDNLKRDLKRMEKLPLDKQLADLKEKATAFATDAEGSIEGGLRQALLKLKEHNDSDGLQNVFMAGLIGQVQAQLNALRQEFNLPDVSNAADKQLAAEMSQWDKE